MRKCLAGLWPVRVSAMSKERLLVVSSEEEEWIWWGEDGMGGSLVIMLENKAGAWEEVKLKGQG